MVKITDLIFDYYKQKNNAYLTIKELASLFFVSADTFRRNADKLTKTSKLNKYCISSYRGSQIFYSIDELSQKEIMQLTIATKKKAKDLFNNRKTTDIAFNLSESMPEFNKSMEIISKEENQENILKNENVVVLASDDAEKSKPKKVKELTAEEILYNEEFKKFDFEAWSKQNTQDILNDTTGKYDINTILPDVKPLPTKILKIGHNIRMEIPDVSSKYENLRKRIENVDMEKLTDEELFRIVRDDPMDIKRNTMSREEFVEYKHNIFENFMELDTINSSNDD